jgi:hypothetical protein
VYNRLTAEQVAKLTSLHRLLIENSITTRPLTVIHEYLDVEQAVSFALFRCRCTDNPHCTGFVLGVIECDSGARVMINMKKEQLATLVGKVWSEIGAEVRA